jgi:NADPH:quinone reductase
MLPKTMNAIEITRASGPEVLQPTTRPVPQPEAGQVAERLHARKWV